MCTSLLLNGKYVYTYDDTSSTVRLTLQVGCRYLLFIFLLLFVSAGVLLLTSYTRTHIICGYNFARASARTHLTLTYSYVGVIINSTTASTTHMCFFVVVARRRRRSARIFQPGFILRSYTTHTVVVYAFFMQMLS